jgi:DNA-binding phage protein
MAKTHRTHEEATTEMFLKDPELASEYLNSVLADGDESDLMLALRSLCKSKDGMRFWSEVVFLSHQDTLIFFQYS